MEHFILAILISTLIFIIIPLLCVGFVFFIFKKKLGLKLAVFVSAILLIIFSFFIITNFYPLESFYSNNFEENTKLTLPDSAKLIRYSGNNTIYSFGDYNISYIYQLETTDYNHIYSQLLTKGFHSSDVYLETSENEYLINSPLKYKRKKILTKNFGFKNFDILFLIDNKTIICNSNKW